jgi:hypothetical protein
LVGANAAKFEVIENGDDVSYDGVDQDEGAVSYFMSSHPEIHMFNKYCLKNAFNMICLCVVV